MSKYLLILVLLLSPLCYAKGSSHHRTDCVNRQVGYDLYQDCTHYAYGELKDSYTNYKKDYYTPENIKKREESCTRGRYIFGALMVALLGWLGLLFYGLCRGSE
jgi:hypothetical protein